MNKNRITGTETKSQHSTSKYLTTLHDYYFIYCVREVTTPKNDYLDLFS